MLIARRFQALLWGLICVGVMTACSDQGDSMTSGPGDRSAAEVRRQGNRLQHEASLYLRQHAANPVDWFPWGDEALALARAEDRPIFLSSGYSSCHWCHVMEHEVFEHDDVGDYLNRHFVCIKVDREELPEVDATYMEAVQLMTGSGGWPMTVFLTPDLEPFFGATYVPKERFMTLLQQIVALWRDRREEVTGQAATVAERLRAEPRTEAGGAVEAELLAAAVQGASERFDQEFGGFQGPMKFPVPVRWSFLLHYHRKTGDPEARRMVEETLTAMAQGGLYDHVGGGFHRYTVDAHWTVPHFEKMLYDNAQLASLYLEAGVALDRPDFTAVGVDVLEFLDREMVGPEGAVYASFDADSDGEEGTYYAWSPAQITAAVGEVDGPVLADLLGVTAEGNFEAGLSVATRRTAAAEVARRHGRSEEEVRDLWAAYRGELRAARAERVPPTLDHKVITSWNGLALSAFVAGAMVTGRDDFRARAESIVDYLERVHWSEVGELARASYDGRTVGKAALADHAFLARGLQHHFSLTGSVRPLAWSQQLLEGVRADFARTQGAWYTTSAQDTAPLGRRLELFDSVIPSGCSVMLEVMLTHGSLTGDAAMAEAVSGELANQAGLLKRAGLEMAGWFDVALRLAGPLHEVVIVGDRDDADFNDLWRVATAKLSPGVVVMPVASSGASRDILALAPTLAEKTILDGAATVYVCRLGSCGAPTGNHLKLKDLIENGWFR